MKKGLILTLILILLPSFVLAQDLECTATFAWEKPSQTMGTSCDSTDGNLIPASIELGYTMRWRETGDSVWANMDVVTTADVDVTNQVLTFPCFMNIDIEVGAYFAAGTSKTIGCWSATKQVFLEPTDPPGKVIWLE